MPTAEEYKSRYERFVRYISNAANGKGVIDPENAKSIKFVQDLLRKLEKYEPKVSSTGNKEEDERSYWSKKYFEAFAVWDEILDRSQEDKRKRETEEKKAYYEREYQSYKEEKQSERSSRPDHLKEVYHSANNPIFKKKRETDPSKAKRVNSQAVNSNSKNAKDPIIAEIGGKKERELTPEEKRLIKEKFGMNVLNGVIKGLLVAGGTAATAGIIKLVYNKLKTSKEAKQGRIRKLLQKLRNKLLRKKDQMPIRFKDADVTATFGKIKSLVKALINKTLVLLKMRTPEEVKGKKSLVTSIKAIAGSLLVLMPVMVTLLVKVKQGTEIIGGHVQQELVKATNESIDRAYKDPVAREAVKKQTISTLQNPELKFGIGYKHIKSIPSFKQKVKALLFPQTYIENDFKRFMRNEVVTAGSGGSYSKDLRGKGLEYKKDSAFRDGNGNPIELLKKIQTNVKELINRILACLKLRNVSEQQRTAKSAKQIAFATTGLILTLTGVLYDKYSKSTRVLGEATAKHLSEEHEKRYVQSYLNQLELPPEAANWNESDLQEWFGRNILNAKTKYSKEKLNNLLKNAGRINSLKEEQKMGKRVLMQTKKRGVGKFAKALFKPEKYVEEDFKSHFEKF